MAYMSARPSLSEEFFIGRRENARAMIGAPAKLTLVSGLSDCYVIDLSCTGARIATSEVLKPGLEALIAINDIELFGQIVWGKRGQFGLVFEKPLPIETVVQLRWQADQICEYEKDEAVARIRDWVEGRI